MPYAVIKKKNGLHSLEAINVNLKRARLISNHPHDRYATYLVAEIVEKINPGNDRETEVLAEESLTTMEA